MTSPLRLFAALELPAGARGALASWGRAACDGDQALRPVARDALHLTLHFLGARRLADLDGLRAAVAGAPASPVPLVTGGAVWLAPRRPHVLACGVEDRGGALCALHAALAPALVAAAPGWTPDARPLNPHVTVARVRRGIRPRPGSEPRAPRLVFEAAAVVLLRSHLGPGGARYETLERLALRRGS